MIKVKCVFKNEQINPAECEFQAIPRTGESVSFPYNSLKYRNGDMVTQAVYIVDTVIHSANSYDKHRVAIILK